MAKIIRLLLVSFILTSSMVFTSATTVYAISIPAEVNKQFTPILIDAGGISVLRVTIFNPNTFPLTNANWTDNLIGVQSGLSIAPPGLVNNTCGGSVTAVPGTTALSLTGGSVPAQVGATPGECYVEINVTSTTPGNLINTIPSNNLVASGNDNGNPVTVTNTTPASATLTVVAVIPPTLSKGFAPNTISMGNVSTLSITINNNDTNTNLTGTSFTDTLPANVVLAIPVSPILTNCGASASLAAVAGGNTIALTNATVTPNLNCVVTVNVTSATQGAYVNTIPAGPGGPGSITTDQGVTNGSPASATLNVQPISIAKQFNPPSFQAGGTSTLTITLQNPTTSNYTGVNFSDTLPVTPNTNLTYVLGTAVTTCAPGTATNTTTTVTLTGGTIPANSTCTVTVNVTVPPGATAATYTNIIPPGAITIASNPGVTTVVGTTADVSVYATGTGMTGAKSFSIDPINAGQNTRLRIDLFAPADTNLTNFSMIDNLPAGVTVSNVNNLGVPTPPVITGCGPTPPRVLDAATGNTFISLTGGAIDAGARCRIDVWVTSSTPGTVTNTISPANISNNENRDPSGNLTDTLTVNGAENLSTSKTFTPPTVSPGGLSVLTITLQNTYPSPLINVSLTDPLPGSVTDGVVVAPVPNASTTCLPGGSVTAVPGSQTITLAGGTVPAQVGTVPGICTITVTVQGNDSNAVPSNRINTIPITNVSGTVQSTGVTINPISQAQATLTTEVLSIGVVKGFDPVLVHGGAASTMSIQLVNPSTAELTGIAFTDNMPLGMIIANPANFNTGTCGGTITGNPGDASFSYSGGNLPAHSNCTLTLMAIMFVNGNLTNTIPAGAVTTFNGVSSPQATSASLTNLPGANVTKAFGPNSILAGAYSALTITVQNTSITPLVNMGLIDDLPTGLLVTGPPTGPAPVTDCGGTLTAVAGSQIIQLVNGTLAGSTSCTIVVSVTGNTPGNYINTIPTGALTNNQGATNTQPATDTLVVTGSPSGLTKIISTTNQPSTNGSNITIGEIITYKVDVVIPPGVYTGATLVDTMQRGLAFVGCNTINAPGLTTNVAGGFNSICNNPVVLPAMSADPADIDRRVTFNFGTLTNDTQSDAVITVTYRAMVLNLSANVDGVVLNNSAVWNSSDGSIGPAQTTVNILEPDLAIAKTANVNFIANGSAATFTLAISHTPASHTDAFDVVISDVLPTGLDYVQNSLDCNSGEQDPDAGSCVYDAVTRTIKAKWSTFTLLPAGDRGIIRFNVVGNASIPANGNVTNVANVEWSSIPGDQTDPQSFSTPPNPFATERFYDPTASVSVYTTSASLTLTPLGTGGGGGDGGGGGGRGRGAGGFLIPVTGFAPNTVTQLSTILRPAYKSTNLTIEIPVIKVKTSIVGVQLKNRNWDISWLQDQIGWLNGTAYPTWEGNSVLTAHVVNAVGQPGVFSNLRNLNTGEYIFVYNLGYRYTYKVVSNKYVQPNDITVLKHEEKAYLTLITCDNYNEKTGLYLRRIAVRAVLVDVREVK